MLIASVLSYLALTLAIGAWSSRLVNSASDFTLAGRHLPASVVGVTVFATWFGSDNVVGNSEEFARDGMTAYVALVGGCCVGLVLLGLFYAPRLYAMNITTVGDFFRLRFDQRIERVTSLLITCSYPTWIAAQLVAFGAVFASLFGTPTSTGVIGGAVIVLVYTWMGGMWAVSLTDVLQSAVMMVGLLAMLVVLLAETGGLAPVIAAQADGFFRPVPDGGLSDWTDFLAVFLALSIGTLPVQEIYQRAFAARDLSDARSGVLLGAVLLLTVAVIPLVIAMTALHAYPDLSGAAEELRLLPEMVSRHMGLPLQILFFGALISAILSTCSGALIAPATVIGENLIRPLRPGMTDDQLLLWTRFSVVLVAVISCGFALRSGDIIELVVAATAVPLVALFAPLTFGLFWNRTTPAGVWTSMAAGIAAWVACLFLETRVDATLWGLLASVVGVVLGSLLSRPAEPSPILGPVERVAADRSP